MGFVPSLIIQHLLKKQVRKFPEKQSFKTVVMFADISGFTNLSETLQKRGNEGSELLAFVLNRYMELLIKSIGRSGGDIFKFAGDAMIVLWPPPKSEGSQLELDLLTLCRQAVQSGLDIKNKLNGAVMFEKKIRLSVKIGFGIGDVTIMHVGGVFQRAEYLPAGDPLTQAFECEHLATGGGQVIVSMQVWDKIKDYFNGEMIQKHDGHEESKNGPFQLILNLKAGQIAVQTKADALLIRTKISQGSIQAILPFLESYIPKALLPYIKIDQEKWSAELRRLSVMFLNLGVDLTDAKTVEGLDRIQSIIRTVQSCLYQNEGSLNKLLMDDKGSTLIVVFGLPPLAHQDDAVRGILTAFKLRQELSKINCACSIGLTTGLVFTGVVGTSGNRREYSVLGDTVNLSARLMQAACGEKEYKVFVDEETKRDAEHKIRFKFFECRTVKGKTEQIPIYAPINCLEENEKLLEEGFSIRTHMHNIPDDAFMIEQYKDSFFMLRREKEVELIMNILKDFLEFEVRKVVLIKGEYGIGKSLFMRCVLESFKKLLNNEKKLWNKENIFIFINGLNSLTQKKTINGWRKFLRYSIEKLKIRFNLLDFKEVFKHLKVAETWKNKIIENILELDSNEMLKKEIIIEKEMISKEEASILKEFMLIIIEKLIEKNYPPLILCFDDMQNFDEESWSFLLELLEKFEKKLFIFCIIRDSDFESGINQIIFHKFQKKIQKIIKQEQFLKNSAQIQLKEIKIMDSLSLAKKILRVNDIPDNLLYFFHQKTKGNPLKLIHLIQNLLSTQFLQKNMEKIIISEELSNLLYINEFITLPIPLASVKINSSILDKLNCKQILLMKLASVIGDSFNLTVLKQLNPFKDQGILNDEVENLLKDLEKNEIIGIIDETESNITYQFNDLFMREVLYQRMTYNQRREFHKLFAESMQNFNTNLFLNSKSKAYEKIQSEKIIFHWRLAESYSVEIQKNGEKSSNLMTGFSNLAKRSVIVKKISSLAAKFLSPLSTLKKGNLHFKFQNSLLWSKKFFVLSFKELKIFSNEDDFMQKSDKFLGLISLKQIFSLAFMSQKNRNVFLLKSGSFQKDNKDTGLVQLYFSHEEFDVLEEWAIYIEFARAKAIYDDFVNTFGKIAFPLQSEQRIIKKERAIRKKPKKMEGSQSSMSIKDYRLINDSVKDFGVNNVSFLQSRHQKLKENLTFLINNSLLLFLSNLVEKASIEQSKDRSLSLGKNTSFLKRFPSFFQKKEILMEEDEIESPVDGQLNNIFINRLDNSLGKKSLTIEIKSFLFNPKKSLKKRTEDEENLIEEESTANIPADSLDSFALKSRIKFTESDLQKSLETSFNDKLKNNTKNILTFNSTNSEEIRTENKQALCFENITPNASGGNLSTQRLNFMVLSQIKYRYLAKEEFLPLFFYSRRNSIKKSDLKEKNKILKPKNIQLKVLTKIKSFVYDEFEMEKKVPFSEENKKSLFIYKEAMIFLSETKKNNAKQEIEESFIEKIDESGEKVKIKNNESKNYFNRFHW